ncbi:RNA-binding protein [Tumidithrix helvetica PCC 7403]|uniref:RNA recognition motif domain-containing protein n=1 Tax=Tumidithrix helvetica TaxID=3457545 RepID=UPI003CA3AE15
MSIRLYVGNLPSELDRQALEKIFNESGDSVSLKVITDRKTGRCRGFGFVTVGTPELADTVIEKFNGFDFNGAVLKLEKALPRSKGKSEDGEGGEESSPDAEGTPSVAVTSNIPAPTPKTAASKRSKSKRSGGGRTASTSSTSTSLEAHQPDPRWANELEKFKQQLLAAQAVN